MGMTQHHAYDMLTAVLGTHYVFSNQKFLKTYNRRRVLCMSLLTLGLIACPNPPASPPLTVKHEHTPESHCRAGWGGGRLIGDFYYCYFPLQNCRKTVPVGERVSRWKAETQVGGRLPINHEGAGKEIETGNANTKTSFVWVSLKAQARSRPPNTAAAPPPSPPQRSR